MTTQRHVDQRKRAAGVPGMRPERVRPSQRELVLASLVRCPERKSLPTARKGA
jgi:hypothetical protein